MVKKLEFLLVGDRGEKSLSDYRRAILTAYSILVGMGTSIYYVVINLFKNYNPSLHFYYIFIFILIVAFSLNRIGRHWLAKCTLLSTVNFVVFAFSSREPAIPAAFLFFILSSIMALSVFDAKEKKSTVMFVGLSLILYLIARFTTFALVPTRPIDPEYIIRAYNNNLLIVFSFSILAVYFLVRINHSVEESLQQREKQILEKNQILIKTNEELDRFIYSTSHDLRAPLNSIEGLINLSQKSNDPEELNTYHTMMRDRVKKLEHVLSDISHYSKNTKLEVERKPVRIYEYINQALFDVKFLDTGKNVRVQLDIEEDMMIETDPMRLSIILNNLISNAFKYSDQMKDDPYLIIKAYREDQYSVIVAKDNGEGIDEVHQPKIFGMFYRGTTRSKGSGLGLYLVKETVEKLGGTIDLVSVRGEGTTFTIKLPR